MSKLYLIIIEQLNLYTSVEISSIKYEGFSEDEFLKAIHYLTVKNFITVNKTQIWLSKEGQQFFKLFKKEGDKYITTVKLSDDFQSLSDSTLEWRERFFKDFNKDKASKILVTDKMPITQRIMKISFIKWVGIFSIISSVIAIWIYVLFPIVKDFLNWIGW
jgi:hypothetical protein